MTTKEEIADKVESEFDDIFEPDDWGGMPFTFRLCDFEIVGEDENEITLKIDGWSYSDDDVVLDVVYDKRTGKFIM